MKILRQKLFTFQDKKAFLEFYKATGGLKHLPKGKKGMRARDVYRIKDIAQKIDTRDLEGVNYDEARQILERMGLPESGKGIKHLIQKYKNIYDPEFQERFNRIYNRSDRRRRKYKKKMARVEELQHKYDSPRNKIRLNKIRGKIGEQDYRDRLEDPYTLVYPKTLNKIKTVACKEGQGANQRLANRIPIKQEDLNPGTEIRNAFDAVIKKANRVVPEANLKYSKDAKRNSYYPSANLIVLKPGANSSSFGHEVGHAISNKKELLGQYAGLNKLAEENYATSQSNAIHNLAVKKGKLSPIYVKRGEEELNDGFITYLDKNIIDTSNTLIDKFPIYRRK